MADHQDVELRIRATNYSKKPLDQIVVALKDMTDAQTAQIDSAKKGTATADQLSAAYKKIENAAKALLGQQALTKEFEAQSAKLAELKTKVDAARLAQKAFSDSLPVDAERTKKQQDELNKLGRAITTVENQYLKAEARVAKTTQTMAEAGIAAATLAASQQKIRDAVATANAALERQERALDSMDGWEKQRRDAAEAAAAQQRASAAREAATAKAMTEAQRLADLEQLFTREVNKRTAAIKAQEAAAASAAARNTTAASAAAEARAAAAREAADAEAMADAARLADLEQLFTREVNKRTAAIRAQQQALEAAAASAERLMRASNTTSRGRTPVVDAGLANQIRDIQNPADAAVRSVAGIEAAVKKLETRVREIRGPVQDYRGALEDARRTQAALAATAGNVDAFTRQKAAVVEARYEYTKARTVVAGLIAELRSGATGADITTRLAQAKRTMEQAARDLGNLTTTANASREALRRAGIDTRNLTQAEAELVAQAQRATQSLNQLTQAFQRNGAAGDNAGSRIFNWFGGSGGRTTLSFAQRFRGEVLALGASFVGLYAAVGLARDVLDAYNATNATMNRLIVANGGDVRAAADDFKYLQAQADRIGVSFAKVAPAFAKFAIAAKMAGATGQETRFIFEGFATATAKLGLAGPEVERVFKAIEQMFNKGKVSAEELTQQLGDVMPGALNLFAKAQGVTVAEFIKLMELGKVGPEIMIGVARLLKDSYSAAGEGVLNLAQAQARFDNAATRFKNSTAKGGFVESYNEFLMKLTALMNDGQGDILAKNLSAGFSAVIGVMSLVADNIDFIKVAVVALIGIKFLSWLASLPALFLAVKVEVAALNGMLLLLNTRLSISAITATLTSALGAMGIATAGLTTQIGLLATALRGLALAIPILGAAAAAYFGTKGILDAFADSNVAGAKKAIDASAAAYEKAVEARDALTKAAGTKEEAQAKAHYEKMRNLAGEAEKKRQAAIQKARDSYVPLSAEQEASMAGAGKSAVSAKNARATEDPGDRPVDFLKKTNDELAAEDKRSAKALKQQRLRSAKEELADRLEIIDEQFQARRDAAALEIKDETQLKAVIGRINESSLKAQAVERLKFQNEQASKSKESGNARVRQEESVAERIAKITEELANKEGKADPTIPYAKRREAAVGVVAKAYRELENDIAKYAKANPKQAASDLARTAELKKQADLLAGQNSDRKEAERLAKDFEDRQTVLTTQIKEINDLYEAGRITAEQQRVQTNAAVAELGPGVVAAGEAALEFAERFRSIMDPVAFQTLVSGIRTGIVAANNEAMTAATNLAAQQVRLNTLLDEQKAKLDTIKTQRDLNMITSEQEAERTNAVTEEYKQSIIDTVAELQLLLDKTREVGGISEESYRKATVAANGLTLETANSQKATSDLDKLIVGSVASNGVTAFESLASSIADVATGAQSIGEGFRGALSAVGMFFAALLRDIATAIIKQLILNALMKAIGGATGGAGAAGGTVANTLFHSGGIVGRGKGVVRELPREAFNNAMRYHTGGLAGFRPNEVPAILERNEEVLTRDDPRHVLNGGTKPAGGGGGSDAGQRFVLVDDRANVTKAMQSSAGEKVTLVHLKNNLSTIKAMLK